MSRYATPVAFKAALEDRLRSAAQHSGDQNRLRMRLIMDRFAARLLQEYGDAVVLKGGLVLELRLANARATKDIDLHLRGKPADTLLRFQRAGRLDLGDHLLFEIATDARHPTIDAEGMRYQGLRFRAQGRLAGKVYGEPFGVDAAFSEPMAGVPEIVEGSDFLAFASIPPPRFPVYPLETHIAEKVHAYTMPRPRPNSRVKDLPDLALLAMVREVEADLLRIALSQTFGHRAVHLVPAKLPPPDEAWRVPYARLAQRDRLVWPDLDAVFAASSMFLDPVLAGHSGRWDPAAWAWRVGSVSNT